MGGDVNGTFNERVRVREEERDRRAARLPQTYPSLEIYHEDRLVREPPLQATANLGYAHLKKRR